MSTRRTPRFVPALAICLVPAIDAPGRADDHRVIVAAGKVDRLFSPVHVDLEVERAPMAALLSSRDGPREPTGQVEDLGDGKVRVWWIVDRLAPGKEREYEIRLVLDAFAGGGPVHHWKESSGEDGKSRDLLFGGRPVLRYVHTPFDAGDIELTKKPYHHVFAPDGSRPITKGPRGLYPHHRGIFFGYNKCRLADETVDVWHAQKGEHQVHAETLRELAGPVLGGHEVKILWNDRRGKTFAEERRTVLSFFQGGKGLLIHFSTVLEPTAGPVELGGDRQHAGVQFRAAQEAAEAKEKTRFLRPAAWADLAPEKEFNDEKHRGLPWNAMQFEVQGKRHTMVYMSHPGNPPGAEFSERTYGRFGEFFPWKLDKANPLRARYAFWILEGDEVTREEIEAKYADHAEPAAVRLVE